MIRREHYLAQLRRWRDKDAIKVITGIRRCGKSTLLALFREELQAAGVPAQNIIALNLKGSQLPTAYALRALRRGLAVRSCRGDNES
ncbi:MAG: AAA family ATPase [Veillonellaceae bacterium]|nr:AAA family ATPase [Veillonellaceae bacterium]